MTMTQCQACGGRAQLPLCGKCCDRITQMLIDLQWLLVELDVTKRRQSRLAVGAGRSAEHPLPIDMSAVELSWRIQVDLSRMVRTVDDTVAVDRAHVRTLCWWLRQHVGELFRHDRAEVFLRVIERLVGFSGDGPIHDVINRPDHRFAGTCPDCGALCYAKTTDVYTGCKDCGMPIDVERNRDDTIARHDLMPEKLLLRALDNLDEHVPRVTLYAWITSGRLPSSGYLTDGGITGTKGRAQDPKVYSLARVRSLRRRELAHAGSGAHTSLRQTNHALTRM